MLEINIDEFVKNLEKDIDILNNITNKLDYEPGYEDGYKDACIAIKNTIRTEVYKLKESR